MRNTINESLSDNLNISGLNYQGQNDEYNQMNQEEGPEDIQDVFPP